MRFTKLLLLCGLPMMLLSCSREDENPVFDESLLIGDWQITSLDYSGTTTTTLAGFKTTANFTGKGVGLDMIVRFLQDPNTVVSEGEYSIDLKTTVLGQTSTSTLHFSDFMMPGAWKIEGGNKLIIEAIDVSEEATIKKLDDTDFVMDWSYVTEESEMGISVMQKVKGVYTLTKMQ